MNKSNFDRLLQRYLEGKASEQERIKMEAWLETMKTEDTTNLELTREDENKLFSKITDNLNSVQDVTDFRPGQKEKLTTNQWLSGIAAALLILTVVSYVMWSQLVTHPDKVQVATERGVEKIILNDGTLVWLRGKSKLVYFEKPDQNLRYTELEGEALFEVAKDPGHPFVIQFGDFTIKVVGTSFTVKTGNDIELNVLTGKVNLSSTKNAIGIDVESNQKVIFKNNGEIEKQSLAQIEISRITSNTEYNMQFTNASMEDVFKKIGDKFNVSVSLSNSQIGKCRITADFTDHSLDNTLQMITEVLDVNYSKNGSTVTISGNSCH